jgi:hypothetical protein
VINGEAIHTNLIVFGLTRPGLKPMVYRTREEQANHHTINMVFLDKKKNSCTRFFFSFFFATIFSGEVANTNVIVFC